jgi:hypothetical protein
MNKRCAPRPAPFNPPTTGRDTGLARPPVPDQPESDTLVAPA